MSVDPHNLPPFPKRIPEKLKTIREHLTFELEAAAS